MFEFFLVILLINFIFHFQDFIKNLILTVNTFSRCMMADGFSSILDFEFTLGNFMFVNFYFG